MGLKSFQIAFVFGIGALAVLVYPVHKLYKMYIKPNELGLRISSSTLLDYFKGSLSLGMRCICTKSLKDKVVVITSGSDCTGYKLALQCAKSGARVIMGCDDYTRCKEIAADLLMIGDAATVTPIMLDLKSDVSCRNFADAVLRRESRIDFLVVTTVEFCRQAPGLWERGHLNPIWKTNYFGCVIVIERLRSNFTGEGDNGIVLVSSEYMSDVEVSNLDISGVLNQKLPNRELDFVNYKKAKFALWIYCIYLVNKVVDMDKISFTIIVPNGVCKTGLDLINGFWSRISCRNQIRTPVEFTETILHCMKNSKVQNNRCMMKESEIFKIPATHFIAYQEMVRMSNDLIDAFIR